MVFLCSKGEKKISVKLEKQLSIYSILKSSMASGNLFIQQVRYEYMGENRSAYSPVFGRKYRIVRARRNNTEFYWNEAWWRLPYVSLLTVTPTGFRIDDEGILIEYRLGEITEDTRIEKE